MFAEDVVVADDEFEVVAELGEFFEDLAGVFFDLHALEAGGDDAEVGVEGVGGDGDDFLCLGVGADIDLSLLAGQDDFVIDVFGGDVH